MMRMNPLPLQISLGLHLSRIPRPRLQPRCCHLRPRRFFSRMLGFEVHLSPGNGNITFMGAFT